MLSTRSLNETTYSEVLVKSVMSDVIVGRDGYSYIPLWAVEDYLKLRQDVQMYCGSQTTRNFEESTFSPEWHRHNYRDGTLSWYGLAGAGGDKSIYYIRLDEDKPEYEPT
jgi:hypothetical protein